MKNIKYLFLGNCKSIQEVGEFPQKPSETWITDTRSIFEKYCKSNKGKYDERNRIVVSDGNYYFTIAHSDTFYIVLTEPDYPERLVFELIDECQKENLFLLVDSKGALNNIGKSTLKRLIDSFQNPLNKDPIKKVQNDLDDVKIEIKDNIKSISNNIQNVDELQLKSNNLAEKSKIFHNDAREARKITCRRNWKWGVILGLLLIGVLLIIILPIALTGNKDGNKDDSNNGKMSNDRSGRKSGSQNNNRLI